MDAIAGIRASDNPSARASPAQLSDNFCNPPKTALFSYPNSDSNLKILNNFSDDNDIICLWLTFLGLSEDYIKRIRYFPLMIFYNKKDPICYHIGILVIDN
jgi:hypothetical protein